MRAAGTADLIPAAQSPNFVKIWGGAGTADL